MTAGVRMALLAGSFALVSSPAWTQPPPPPTPGEVLERFPVGREGGPLLLPVTIQGRTVLFCLDTGSTWTAYDKTLAPLLGAPLGRSRISGPDGDFSLDQFAAPKARLGKLPLPTDRPVVTLDLSALRKQTGYDIRGILGMDFLHQHVVQIDAARGQVTFRRTAGDVKASPLLLVPRNGVPRVRALLPGRRLEELVVNTGYVDSTGINLRTELYKELVKEGHVKTAGYGGAATRLEGTITQCCGRLASLALGTREARDVLVASPSSTSMLGLAFLSRYLVTLDFPNGLMYLDEHAGLPGPAECDRSGLQLLRNARGTFVKRVEPGSPADRAGIQTNDKLLQVGDVGIESGSLVAIRRLLSQEGQTVPVRVRREKKTIEIVLRLDTGRTKGPGQEK